MSHFVRIRTEIREREHLVQALRDLHCEFQEGRNLVVRGFGRMGEKAEIVVKTGCRYDIGFRQRAGRFEAVADWSGLKVEKRFSQEAFVAEVSQRYAYNVVKAQAREQYQIVEEEQTLKNGDIVLLLSERG
jgi:predicted GTPase